MSCPKDFAAEIETVCQQEQIAGRSKMQVTDWTESACFDKLNY